MTIFQDINKVKTVTGCTPDNIPLHVLQSEQPIRLKGLHSNWPAVLLAKKSSSQLFDYLLNQYQGMPVAIGKGEAKNNGRLFYNDDLSGFNFTRHRQQFDEFLAELVIANKKAKPDTLYLGSTAVEQLIPSFRIENHLPALDELKPHISIWLGNQSIIAAHHDVPSNIACCVSGKRRFTLFPPEQVENLYIGPLDHTPAGQAISLVDFHNPDFNKHPKFKQALDTAQVIELEPGDAIFIPSMWWHHVEGLEPVNVLVNYWWQTNPRHMGAPMDAMMHALLNISSLPDQQKRAWQAMFEYYVFNTQQRLDHIPKDKLGILEPDSDVAARNIRAMLLNKLNR